MALLYFYCPHTFSGSPFDSAYNINSYSARFLHFTWSKAATTPLSLLATCISKLPGIRLICTMQIKEVSVLFPLCLALSKARELVIHNVICGWWGLCVWVVNVCVSSFLYIKSNISPLALLSPWLASMTDRSKLSANSARLDQRHTRIKLHVHI